MKRIVTTLFAVLTLAIAQTAHSFEEFAVTVDRVGIDGGTLYFGIKESLSGGCQYDIIYVNLGTALGKHAHATLLMAKLVGRKLSRIAYVFDTAPSTQCILQLIEIDD